MRIYTTLNLIKQHDPCSEGWSKLLTFLNKTQADDEPLDLLTILESNGVKDCIWAFQCADDNESIYRHIAADFAESVLHIFEADYPNDNRPRLAIQAAKDFADGKINYAAWAAAWAAAMAAARSADRAAARAAWAAARAAAMVDASSAAMVDARSAAWAAAWSAWAAAMVDASSAAMVDARAAWAARGAELQKQHSILVKWLS